MSSPSLHNAYTPAPCGANSSIAEERDQSFLWIAPRTEQKSGRAQMTLQSWRRTTTLAPVAIRRLAVQQAAISGTYLSTGTGTAVAELPLSRKFEEIGAEYASQAQRSLVLDPRADRGRSGERPDAAHRMRRGTHAAGDRRQVASVRQPRDHLRQRGQGGRRGHAGRQLPPALVAERRLAAREGARLSGCGVVARQPAEEAPVLREQLGLARRGIGAQLPAVVRRARRRQADPAVEVVEEPRADRRVAAHRPPVIDELLLVP